MSNRTQRGHATHSRVVLLVAAAVACRGGTPTSPEPELVVTVSVPGMVASQIEHAVTDPIEHSLRGLPAIAHLRSESREGIAMIAIDLRPGVEATVVGETVRARLETIVRTLPSDAQVPLITRPSPQVAVRYTLAGERSPLELRDYQDRVIRPRLERISGVAHVATCGAEREVTIHVATERLAATGITLAQLAATLRERAAAAPIGTPTATTGIGVATRLGELVIGQRGDVPVRLRDLARITDGAAPSTCHARDERGEVVSVAIHVRAGADPDVVRAAVGRELDTLARAQPTGVRLMRLGPMRTLSVALPARADVTPRLLDQLRATLASAAPGAHVLIEHDAAGTRIALAAEDRALGVALERLREIPTIQVGEPNATIELRGTDLAALVAAATALVPRLIHATLVTTIGLDRSVTRTPTIDRDRAARLGVDPGEITRTLAILSGLEVARVDPDFTPVVLRLPGSLTAADPAVLHGLHGLHVRSRTLGSVPLDALVAFETTDEPVAIVHVDHRRMVGLRVRLGRERDPLPQLPGIEIRVIPD